MNPKPIWLPTNQRKGYRSSISDPEAIFLNSGPKVAAFEEAFASYIGSRYAIAVANGTAALHLSVLCSWSGPKNA